MENKLEEKTMADAISDYASLIWHWSWLLVLCALLAGGITYWVSRRQIPVYQASTTVTVDAAPASQTVTNTSLTASENLAATYAKMMVMKPILDGVAKRLNLAVFPLTASIQAQPITNTQLLEVIVQDTNPKQAALLANTLVGVFSDKLQADQASRYAGSKKGIETQLANLRQQIQTTQNDLAAMDGGTDPSKQEQLQIILTQYNQSYATVLQSYEQLELAEAQSSSGITQQDPATPSEIPIRPRAVLYSLLAALTGLMIAALGVFLIEFLDDTIRDPEEITRKWGVPVLGTIINYPHDKDSLITASQPRSPITEAFRSLRTNLQFTSFSLPIHTILVTSPSPEDGKTTVAANLGSVIAQGGRRAVLVDCDLRRPRLHRLLQISNRDGLSNLFIRAQERLNGTVKSTELDGLHAVTSGNLPPNPSELLGSDRMSEILRQLTEQFDTVILDAPPMLLVTDALVLAPLVDGVLIVIKPSITKRASLKHLLEQLHQVNANILGVVFNDVKIDRSRYYRYHYNGYYYKNQKYSKGYGYTETLEQSEDSKISAKEAGIPRSKFLKITKDVGIVKNVINSGEDKTAIPEEHEPLTKE
jgi:non-specific protein-tyrosine kinase